MIEPDRELTITIPLSVSLGPNDPKFISCVSTPIDHCLNVWHGVLMLCFRSKKQKKKRKQQQKVEQVVVSGTVSAAVCKTIKTRENK